MIGEWQTDKDSELCREYSHKRGNKRKGETDRDAERYDRVKQR